jgi:hypothetical protein
MFWIRGLVGHRWRDDAMTSWIAFLGGCFLVHDDEWLMTASVFQSKKYCVNICEEKMLHFVSLL